MHIFDRRIVISFFVICIFLFLRLFNLSQSLFFFNDMGRDALVMWQWQNTGKPPLLGPQTSALPINQSAIYFYFLYPFYLIIGAPYFAVVMCMVFYIVIFFCGLYFFWEKKKYVYVWIGLFFIFAIHPQLIVQNRYIWNPSLTPPLIGFALLSLLYFQSTQSMRLLWLYSLAMGLAVSLSYSIVPLLVVMIIYWIVVIRRNILKLLFSLFCSLLFWNIPTILFELRHKFLLTISLLTKPAPIQRMLSFPEKWRSLSEYVILSNNALTNHSLFLVTYVCAFLFLFRKDNKNHLGILYLLLVVLTLLLPITVHAHYIFGILVLLFLMFLWESKISAFVTLIVCSVMYLQPATIASYTKSAPRSYQHMEECFKKLCKKEKNPLFVSVVSSYHPYHNGPEHRFLLLKAECDVRTIEEEQDAAQKMIIVEDGIFFDRQTTYWELERFGRYKVLEKVRCTESFGYTLIGKDLKQ